MDPDNLVFLSLLLLFFLLFLTQESHCLRILKLEVPHKAIPENTYTLRCIYDLEGHGLQSVKWYQNDSEFYRHSPSNRFKLYDQTFKGIYGAEVKHEMNSNGTIVYLKVLSEDATGKYKCEVTTEKDFNTVEMVKDLLVSRNGIPAVLQSSNKYWILFFLIWLALL